MTDLLICPFHADDTLGVAPSRRRVIPNAAPYRVPAKDIARKIECQLAEFLVAVFKRREVRATMGVVDRH